MSFFTNCLGLCRRYTPSVCTRQLHANMQDDQMLEDDHLCHDEHGDSCSCSNFLDMDWISSSGNSCEDELCERYFLLLLLASPFSQWLWFFASYYGLTFECLIFPRTMNNLIRINTLLVRLLFLLPSEFLVTCALKESVYWWLLMVDRSVASLSSENVTSEMKIDFISSASESGSSSKVLVSYLVSLVSFLKHQFCILL